MVGERSVFRLLVQDIGSAFGTSGLDDLLLWPGLRLLLCLALAHVHDHAGGGLGARVQLVLLPCWGAREGGGGRGERRRRTMNTELLHVLFRKGVIAGLRRGRRQHFIRLSIKHGDVVMQQRAASYRNLWHTEERRRDTS